MTKTYRTSLVFPGVLILSLLVSLGAAAQGAEDGFDFDTIEASGDIGVWRTDGTFEYSSGNAKLTLSYDDPEKQPLDLHADRIEFFYGEEGGRGLREILLSKNVLVEHPEADITADEARWNATEDLIVFKGDCVLTKPDMKATGSEVTMDLKEGGRIAIRDFKLAGVRIAALKRTSEPPQDKDPSLLTMDDIGDWPGLLRKVKAEGKAEEPSPGKRILELLDAKTKNRLLSLDPDGPLDDDDKDGILKRINKVLMNPELYAQDAWKDIALRDDAKALLERRADGLSQKEVARLNRMLLEAAYTKAIVKYTEAPTQTPTGQ